MQPLAILLPMLFTAFLWWFTTGTVMLVYNRPQRVVQAGFGMVTLMMLVAWAGVFITRNQSDSLGVYAAIAAGVTIWSWQVASYYLGFITGAKQHQLTLQQARQYTHADWMTRFKLALNAGLHHERMSMLFALILLVLTWGQPNQWAMWLYVTLWLLHSSAKVSVFFGVRNFHIEWLPKHMHPLGALLTRNRDNNPFFHVAVVMAFSLMLLMVYRAILIDTPPADVVGLVAIATMIGLGLLEHWLLVLPVPMTLWGYGGRALPEPVAQPVTQNIKGRSS